MLLLAPADTCHSATCCGQFDSWPYGPNRDSVIYLYLPLTEAIERVQEPGVMPLLDRVGKLDRALRPFGRPG